MTIRVVPFTVDPAQKFGPQLIEDIEEQTKKIDPEITYWGIYLDKKQVSYTSSKELAEKTKAWMEKWLNRTN